VPAPIQGDPKTCHAAFVQNVKVFNHSLSKSLYDNSLDYNNYLFEQAAIIPNWFQGDFALY